MKPIRLLAALIAVTVWPAAARAQSQPTQTNDGSQVVTPLKLQLVLTEMDGTKKISSLPYTLRLAASTHPMDTKLNTGVRVPIIINGKDKDAQTTYIEVGTIMDLLATVLQDGRYQLHLSVEHSVIYPATSGNQSVAWVAGDPAPSLYPLIGSFKETCDLIVHDGQTLQATVSSDPVNGHTTTMDVTVNVEK